MWASRGELAEWTRQMGGYLWEGVVVKDQEQVGGVEREGNGIARFGSARGAPSRRRQRRGDRGEVVVEWSWLEVSWRLVLLPQKVLSNDSRKKRTSRFWYHTYSLARVIRRCPVPEHDEMRVEVTHFHFSQSRVGWQACQGTTLIVGGPSWR